MNCAGVCVSKMGTLKVFESTITDGYQRWRRGAEED